MWLNKKKIVQDQQEVDLHILHQSILDLSSRLDRIETTAPNKSYEIQKNTLLGYFGVVSSLAGLIAVLLGSVGAVWAIYAYYQDRTNQLEDMVLRSQVLEIVRSEQADQAIELIDSLKSLDNLSLGKQLNFDGTALPE
ncbi:hypothetical protein [uncultured Roseobacter sp.]|uniref:hypothetical protein n=1 Tax=uncultured Roseobacter sp. TaxID=114847 RepID=UPI00260D852F|nr:hypothetical protein [uncultured Roseobacter sp.]